MNPNPNQIPIDESINYKDVKTLTNDILSLPFEELIKKYDSKSLLDKIIGPGVDNQITTLRDLMIDDFTQEKTSTSISTINKDRIIELLAANQAATGLDTALKQIDPKLILPQSFDQADYQQRASGIWNALINIKRLIAQKIADEYLIGINYFLKFPPKKLNNYLIEVKIISEELIKGYEEIQQTGKTSPQNYEEAINFISRCGRISTFINSLREKHILGDIADIILKIERSIKIVQEIKKKEIINPTPEQINIEIINYLIKDTHI